MKRLVIVPAKGDSTRLPGKNMKELGGQPLLYWTIDIARDHFTTVLVTSDSEELLSRVQRAYKGSNNVITSPEPPVRPGQKVIEVVDMYFEDFDRANDKYDEIWLMLPTCPFKKAEDVYEAKFRISEPGVDSVISITDPEFPPTLFLIQDALGDIIGYHPSHPLAQGNSRSQDQPTTFRPNGALYASKWESFRENRNFYRGKVKGVYMPRSRSIDIDTLFDFRIAEVAAANQHEIG